MKKYLIFFTIALLISLPFLLYFKYVKVSTAIFTTIVLLIALYNYNVVRKKK